MREKHAGFPMSVHLRMRSYEWITWAGRIPTSPEKDLPWKLCWLRISCAACSDSTISPSPSLLLVAADSLVILVVVVVVIVVFVELASCKGGVSRSRTMSREAAEREWRTNCSETCSPRGYPLGPSTSTMLDFRESPLSAMQDSPRSTIKACEREGTRISNGARISTPHTFPAPPRLPSPHFSTLLNTYCDPLFGPPNAI